MIGLVKTGAPVEPDVAASAGATAAAVPTRPARRTAVRGRPIRGTGDPSGRENLRPSNDQIPAEVTPTPALSVTKSPFRAPELGGFRHTRRQESEGARRLALR